MLKNVDIYFLTGHEIPEIVTFLGHLQNKQQTKRCQKVELLYQNYRQAFVYVSGSWHTDDWKTDICTE
jgi:hypothetical protein